MPTEPPPSAAGTALRARALINREDPRISAVAAQLGPELTERTSPDRVHYLAALAVAALDACADVANRPIRQNENRGFAHRMGRFVGATFVVTLALAVTAAAVAVAVAAWRAALN